MFKQVITPHMPAKSIMTKLYNKKLHPILSTRTRIGITCKKANYWYAWEVNWTLFYSTYGTMEWNGQNMYKWTWKSDKIFKILYLWKLAYYDDFEVKAAFWNECFRRFVQGHRVKNSIINVIREITSII